jgi:hypothetical protein
MSATATSVSVTRPQLIQLYAAMGVPEAKLASWTQPRFAKRLGHLKADIESGELSTPKEAGQKELLEQLIESNGSTEIVWSDAAEEEKEVTYAPADVKIEAFEEEDRTMMIPIRSIKGDTDVRNPLSASLKKKNYVFMDEDAERQMDVFFLATSETPEARAKFVELMESECGDIVTLAANIAARGQLHAGRVVANKDGSYDIVYGRRRSLAILYNWCKGLIEGEPLLRATVVSEKETDRILDALSENDDLLRKKPSEYEVALSIKHLHKQGKMKLKDIAAQYGRTEQWVRDQIDFASISGEMAKKVQKGEVKKTAARLQEKKKERIEKVQAKLRDAKQKGKDSQVEKLKEKLEKVKAEPSMMRSKTECMEARDEIAPTAKLTAQQFFDWLFCKTKKLVAE